LYDSNNSKRAAWLLWVMTINGYTDVHVLDGGLQAWIGEGGELETDPVPTPADALVATPTWNEDVIIRREPLLESLDSPNLRLVDTRTAEQQRDTVNGTIREGHIPGSINITNADVQRADGTFKSPEELRELFTSYGINPNDDVVVYSLLSIDSGPVWLAFELAGYDNVRVYQEGYVAWGFNTDLPISTAPYPAPVAATPAASPVASPEASPVASPEPATPVSSPIATPEDGPTDLTGGENPVPSTPAS
jgi:thiosulfate/3-mercaptopyruvate sulfurtransferase